MIFNTEKGSVGVDRVKFGVRRNYAVDIFELYIFSAPLQEDKRQAVKFVEVTMEPVEPNVSSIGAPISLSEEEAQNLMNELWEAGVKPGGGEGHTAHIRALNAHLSDFRKIAFKKLGID